MERQRIVLWRHGQTDWNIASRFQGHSDIALNEVGIRQAERAAPLLLNLEPSRIISSDLIRARMTAEALAKLSGLDESQASSCLSNSSGSEEAQPISMLELLRKYYPESYHDRQIKLKMTLGGNQPPKYLTLILSSMILDRG